MKFRERWKHIGLKSMLEKDLVKDGRVLLISPFGKVEKYQDFRGLDLSKYGDIESVEVNGAIFSNASFDGVKISNSIFRDCRFICASFKSTSEYGNIFENCEFAKTSFDKAKLGYNASAFKSCSFIKCNFETSEFIKPVFSKCLFELCKLNGVDFSVSSFIECKFVGELDDVWFRGDYMLPGDRKIYGDFDLNEMKNVDFSEAKLSWLTFTDGVKLDSVKLPNDEFVFYLNNLKSRFLNAIDHVDDVFDNLEDRNDALDFINDWLDRDLDSQNETIITLNEIKNNNNLGFLLAVKRLLLSS